MFIDNPITSQLKNNFSFSFAIAKTASEVLEKHYNRSIPEGEIGFLAMIFSVVVDHKNKKNRNILFVCASGMATSRFYRVQFENKFGDYINRSYERCV
ncbi:PRD domain-containing protein [Enterococcus sp. 12E11_DIV0728]|uniref:PRD domain-containing protein n=1 Tax=Enterococcus sp. 12E11_DIV0728 TaxID=1834168 RepID=UPI000A348A46